MMSTLWMIFMTLTITLMLTIMLNFITKKTENDREKSSPFECGFEPKSSPRTPFSIQFFMIAIIFLIFDVEISMIIPFSLTSEKSNMKIWFLILSFFLIMLIIGTIHEWYQGALNWMN